LPSEDCTTTPEFQINIEDGQRRLYSTQADGRDHFRTQIRIRSMYRDPEKYIVPHYLKIWDKDPAVLNFYRSGDFSLLSTEENDNKSAYFITYFYVDDFPSVADAWKASYLYGQETGLILASFFQKKGFRVEIKRGSMRGYNNVCWGFEFPAIDLDQSGQHTVYFYSTESELTAEIKRLTLAIAERDDTILMLQNLFDPGACPEIPACPELPECPEVPECPECPEVPACPDPAVIPPCPPSVPCPAPDLSIVTDAVDSTEAAIISEIDRQVGGAVARSRELTAENGKLTAEKAELEAISSSQASTIATLRGCKSAYQTECMHRYGADTDWQDIYTCQDDGIMEVRIWSGASVYWTVVDSPYNRTLSGGTGNCRCWYGSPQSCE